MMINYILGFLSGFIAVLTSWFLTTFIRGKNISDLGVRVFEYRRLALIGGVLSYLFISFLIILFLKKILTGNSSFHAGTIQKFLLGFSVLYFIFLIWVYG